MVYCISMQEETQAGDDVEVGQDLMGGATNELTETELSTEVLDILPMKEPENAEEKIAQGL